MKGRTVSSEETRIEEELVEEAMKAEDAGSVEKEIEKGDKGAAETDACAEDAAEEKTGEEEPAEEKQAEPEKKGFFGKKKEKKDPKDAKIEELTDRLQRNMAEFEIGARDIIEKILPVVDNFERGLAAVPEEDKGAPFAEGMEKIYRQLMKTLEDAGVKPIEAVGQPFDPNFHNAVMHIDDESLGENTIAMELQKGYTYRDTVVRHSMVQVAN